MDGREDIFARYNFASERVSITFYTQVFEPLGSFHLFQVTNRFTAIVLAGSGRRTKAVKLNATRERKGVGERNVEVEVT